MNATLSPMAQRKLAERDGTAQNLRNLRERIRGILGVEDSSDLVIRQLQAAEVENKPRLECVPARQEKVPILGCAIDPALLFKIQQVTFTDFEISGYRFE